MATPSRIPPSTTMPITHIPPPTTTSTFPRSAPAPSPAPQPSSSTSTSSITISNFRISTTKLPILNASEIDSMAASLGITPPEMIFGNNEVRIEYIPPRSAPEVREGEEDGKREGEGGEGEEVVEWAIYFNAHDALDLVDKTGGNMLKVAYSEAWQRQRENLHEGIKEYVKPFDWSYTTGYRGTLPKVPYRRAVGEAAAGTSLGESSVSSDNTVTTTTTTTSASSTTSTSAVTSTTTTTAITTGSTSPAPHPPSPSPPTPSSYTFHPTTHPLPIQKLLLPDPILFFDDVILYEDELADNGMSLLSVKIRVMPHRLLLLSRFFLRLDDVVWRIRDTRVYIEFGNDERDLVGPGEGEGREKGRAHVIREYTEKEAPWGDVLKYLHRYPNKEIPAVMRDAQKIAEWLPVVKCEREMLVLR